MSLNDREIGDYWVRGDGSVSSLIKGFCGRTGQHLGHGWTAYLNSRKIQMYCPGIKGDAIPVSRETPNMASNALEMDLRGKSESFLRACGLEPTPDATEQLVEVFLPCLEIVSSRGYHPEGNTWRESGWRGIMTDIRKKAQRLWYRGWINGKFDKDSAVDLINFCGFYIRHGNQGKPWGEWGEPGTSDLRTEDVDVKTVAEKASVTFGYRQRAKMTSADLIAEAYRNRPVHHHEPGRTHAAFCSGPHPEGSECY